MREMAVAHFRLPLLLLNGLALLAQTTPDPLQLLAKIPLPGVVGRLDHLAADIYQRRLFLAALENGTVEVIDVRSSSAVATIRGLPQPQGVVYAKSVHRLFVSCADGTLRIFDANSFKPTGTVRLGFDADSIRLNHAGDRLWVGYGGGSLALLDLTGKKLADIPLKVHPESFQLAENRPRLFMNLPDERTVAVVDTEQSAVINRWPVKDGVENFPLALDEANQRVFVACRRPARLIVLDMAGLSHARLPTVSDADDLFFDPIHSRIYVTGGGGRIAIYGQDTPDHYSDLGRITTSPGARTSLFVPEWNRFFVALPAFGKRGAEIRVYQPR